MPVCASVKRAVAMASKCLDNQGHTIVSVRLPDLRHIFHLYASAATVDGGEYLIRRLEGEPIDEAHKKFVRLLGLPQIVRFVVLGYCKNAPDPSSREYTVRQAYSRYGYGTATNIG